jgi:hypothetical protein
VRYRTAVAIPQCLHEVILVSTLVPSAGRAAAL